jgi:hypothetical protein
MEPLGAVLVRDRLLKQAVRETSNPVSNRDWERAVGTRIASKTRPARLTKGTLTVIASSPVWSNELSLLAEPILERLRSMGVKVRELRFRVGTIEPDVGANRRPAKLSPRPVEVEAEIGAELAKVEDEGLREALAAAAARMLAFRPNRTRPR